MTSSLHSGSPLVVLEDVHLTLGSAAGPVNILCGVSLAIVAGETVSLLGPSGSGKSTVMMVMGGLEHRLTHYPGQLSGGEQQRVAIARAFIAGPKLLLADEPTGNLDAVTGRLVIDCLFEERARHGTTLLLITHDPSIAERCERQIHLLDGRIIEDRRAAPSRIAAARRVL